MGIIFINIHRTAHKLYALSLCVMNKNIHNFKRIPGRSETNMLFLGIEDPRVLPGVDLQCGLQELSALLLGLGQLLHAQEVPGSPHLQDSDHGRVGVQSKSYL